MASEGPGGIATFVGRVTGRLDAAERAWVTDTSTRIDELRAALGDAHARIATLETATADPPLPDGGWPGPAGVDTDLARDLGFAVAELRGEQLVDELLTAGILAAPPGATGTVAFGPADSWDLDLTAPGGGTVARADVMLAATATEVAERLAANPLIDVVYTSTDAADRLADRSIAAPTPVDLVVVRPGDAWPTSATGPIVVDVGITAADLDEALADVRASLGADGGSTAANGAPRAILDAVPLLALGLIAARAAADAATTDRPGDDIAGRVWHDARDVVTTAGLSHLVTTVSGLALLRVPVSLTLGLGRSAVRDARTDVDVSIRRVARVRRLLARLPR